jgi:hypothetical protein
MSDALLNLGLILCAGSAFYIVACLAASILDRFTRSPARMATVIRRGKHYQGRK